mgnify:FL=1|tara:strand:+ start:544 stop:3516 length:2973 start_codon:yes stop_codon:yes gene_type:complete
MTDPIQKNTDTSGKTFDKEVLNNPQMMLLDIFSEIPLSEKAIDTTTNVSGPGAPNVPKISKDFLKTVNSMIQVEVEKNSNFINLLTPNEYAQMVPKIDLFLVNAKDPGLQLSIPLTSPANIQKGLGSLGYYTTNNVGLKTLEMRLDGTGQPLFGKTYYVKVKLIFDSLNTFTDKIPGSEAVFGESLTYAQVFRAAGRTGVSPWFTKITISYSTSNKEINEKYALNSEALAFSLSLNLIKTNLNLEENSKTIVDVEYFGQEESLFGTRELFDILNLDLASAAVVLERNVKDAKTQRDIAIKAAETYAKARSAEGIHGKKFLTEIDEQIKQSVDREEVQRRITTSNTESVGEDEKSAASVIIRKEKALQEQLRAQKQKFIDSAEAAKNSLIGKATADYDNEKQKAEAKFDNLRMDQISKALEETFFSAEIQKSGVIKEITIDAKSIIEYYNNILSSGGTVKDLLSDPGNSASKKTRKKPVTADQETTAKNTAIRNFTYKIEELISKKEGIARQSRLLQGKIKEQQSKKTGSASEERNKAANIEQLNKQKGSVDEQITEIDKQINELQKQRSLATQTSEVLGGTIEQIVKEFSNFYTVRYILFGDLVRLVFNRIYNNINSNIRRNTPFVDTVYPSNAAQVAENTIKRSRFIFSDITLFAGKDRVAISRDIYDLPISLKNLKYILAKKLYGTSKNSLSVFEIMQSLINLVSVARINKGRLLNVSDFNGSYQLGNITFSLTGESPNFKIIKNTKAHADLKHGLILYAKRKSDGESIVDDSDFVPTFTFGGVDRGALKKIGLEAIKDSDLEKVVFEQLNYDKKMIPLIFEVSMTTVGLPIFQLGMRFNVITPTLNTATDPKVNGWFYGEGQYQVKSVDHYYSAGGFFETKVTGVQYSTKRQVNRAKAQTMSAGDSKAKEREVNRLIQEFKAKDEQAGVYSSKVALYRAQIAAGTAGVGKQGANKKLAEQKLREKLQKEEALLKQYPEYAAGTTAEP